VLRKDKQMTKVSPSKKYRQHSAKLRRNHAAAPRHLVSQRLSAAKIGPELGRHVVWNRDSATEVFKGNFDLVLCSPPYFHPRNSSMAHGFISRFADLDQFAEWVARILLRTSLALKPRRFLCFVKTDVKYRRTILPIGSRIAEWSEKLGLPVRAHWVWERLPHYSPYAPSLANIFVVGNGDFSSLCHSGLFRTDDWRMRSTPSSFTPVLFEQLIRQLTRPHSCVLDPFFGLGSTLLAASRSGRWSVGVELSPGQITRARDILKGRVDVSFRS
jgi:DNA modification methylase